LDAARAAGAGYADVRVCRYRREDLIARDGRARGFERSELSGIGVRCLIDGAWGFAASQRQERDEIARLAGLAADMARANRRISRGVALAPLAPRLDAWQTPLTKE